MTPPLEKLTISGARKAAILLTVLGEDSAATVFRNLDEKTCSELPTRSQVWEPVPVELSLQVFEEYQRITQAQDFIIQGGHDLARRLLGQGFWGSRRRGHHAAADQGPRAQPLESLQRADPQKLARFLEAEHPQTIALILGQLGDRQASALLMSLPNEIRAEAVKRLANLRRFSPEMAEKVSIVLAQRLKAVGEQGKRAYSGFQSVADIMNCIDTTVAQEILVDIENEEPTLAISIRDLMFTFEDFLQVGESQIRELTGAIDKRVLATALKGTNEELKNHFFRTMSSRAIEMLKEDIESLGPFVIRT
jgi:flagellar motor switch protein FliG